MHVYRPPLQSVQQAVAAGPRRTAQPAGQQRPASQPVSVFCNFLFLLLPHFLCIYVCVCPALDPDFTAISRASALVPLNMLGFSPSVHCTGCYEGTHFIVLNTVNYTKHLLSILSVLPILLLSDLVLFWNFLEASISV